MTDFTLCLMNLPVILPVMLKLLVPWEHTALLVREFSSLVLPVLTVISSFILSPLVLMSALLVIIAPRVQYYLYLVQLVVLVQLRV
jgi:hypothetical protein